MRITIKVVILFSVVSFIITLSLGVFFYIEEANIIDNRIEAQLKSISVLKQSELYNYIEAETREIESLAENKEIIDYLKTYYYLNDNINYDNEKKAEDDVKAKLNEVPDHSYLNEVFIMTLEGKIDVSTTEGQKGKIKEKEKYFVEGKNKTFVQNFYYDLSLQRPVIIISAPIKENNTLLGVAVGIVDDIKISEIMKERSGLGKTGETYLVNKYNLLVSELRFQENAKFKKFIYTESVEDCLKGNTGYKYYNDYRNVPVIGYYSLLPNLDVCLITEIDQEEALEPIAEFRFFILILSAILSIVGFFLSNILSKLISVPLLELKDKAEEIGQGKFDVRIKVKSKDEIGDLAYAFNKMAAQLEYQSKKIQQHEKELHHLVDQKTLQLKHKVNELEKTKLAIMNVLEDAHSTNKQLKEAREQLRKTITELRLMDKKKDEFLSITAHELKTPLTSIRGFTDLLTNENVMKNPQLREKYFSIIVQDTKRLENLVNDILDLSRLDIGTMKFDYEQITVSEVIKELKNLSDISIKKKGLRSIYKVEKDLPKIYVDKSRLIQVLSNLINNSIKYTEKGFIKIEVFRKNNFVHFRVSDTGIGIPKKEQKRIFERFYQVDSSFTRKVGGFGLGLAICKAIIEKFGGKIWVAKSSKKGTVFEFTVKINHDKNNEKDINKKDKD